LEFLAAAETGEDQERIRLLVESSLLSGISLQEMVNRSGMSAKRIEAALSPLLSGGSVLQVVKEPRIFLGRDAFAALKQRLSGELSEYLAENPMQEGIGKEELKSRIPKRSDPRFFGPVLASMEKEGLALSDRDIVKLPGRKAGVTKDQAGLQAELEEALKKGWTEPPTVKELCDQLRCTEKQLLDHANMLVREGRAAKVKGDVFYTPGAVSELKEKLIGFLKEKGEITPPEFREVTGLSRKFMIPLLEYFDQEKVTMRVGDKRVLRRG
jgi:selenocysteine-specific elongation factor